MTIRLYYPDEGTVTSEITLRNPENGDSEQYDNNILFHIGMNGSVNSYKKKLKEVILLNFSGVQKTDAEAFEAFYLANAGKQLGYVDTIGRTWSVRIMNNPLETVATLSIGSCELKSFTLQMRAVQTGEVPVTGNTLIDDVGNVLVDDDGNVLVYV